MPSRILIIQGHPDRTGGHLCHALADAYAEGAGEAGHAVERVDVATLDFPLLRSKAEFETGVPPVDIQRAQAAMLAATHLVLVYPLWAGDMPALLKGFLEQTLRPNFAFEAREKGLSKKKLKGRSARILVTMGMPAPVYRFYFGAHGLRNLRRNILGLCGIGPIRSTLIGTVEGLSDARRGRWLERVRALGRAAA